MKKKRKKMEDREWKQVDLLETKNQGKDSAAKFWVNGETRVGQAAN